MIAKTAHSQNVSAAAIAAAAAAKHGIIIFLHPK